MITPDRPRLNPYVEPNTYLNPHRGADQPVVILTPRYHEFLVGHVAAMAKFDITTIPFHQIDPAKVTEAQIRAIRRSMLIESKAPDYLRKLLGYYMEDIEMTSFLHIWGGEEDLHHLFQRTALETIYRKQDRQDQLEEMDAETGFSRAGPWGEKETGYTRIQAEAYVDIQEISTGIYYRGTASRIEDPILRGGIGEIGRHEMRHHAYYHKGALARIALDPQHAQDEIVAMITDMDLPGRTYLPDPDETTHILRAASNPTPKDIIAVVRCVKDLIGVRRLIQLARDPKYSGKLKEFFGNIDVREVSRAFSPF